MFNKRMFKLSWYLGWLGTFSWLYGFTVYFLFLNLIIGAISGVILSLISVIAIFLTAPWKYPNTKYYILLSPCFLVLTASILWLIYYLQPITKEAFSPFWFSWVIFMILPIISLGNKTWNDHNIN